MNILLANKFFYPRGGDCIHTIGLKKLLEGNGHKVAIFSMQHPENLANEYESYWPSNLDYGVPAIKNAKEAICRPVYSGEVKRKWNALLDDFKPDVVHLHNIHTQLSPIIAKEAYDKKIPVFWTLHDYKLICPSYSLLRNGEPCEKCLADKTNVIKYRCIKNSLTGSLIGYLESMRWSRKKLETYTTCFIAPSQFLRGKMIEAGFSPEKIKQLYNFTGQDKFRPNIHKKGYYVYLGRISREKGLEILLRAASGLPGFNLKIIGDGPLREELEQKYNYQHIEFLGYQPWETIKTILGEARFMVLPSEGYENNPLSIIESFALGTPVLGSAIGGIPELVSPNENGMLFQPLDQSGLAVKVSEMMKSRDWDYAQISKKAKGKFDMNKYYQSLLELYQATN